MSLRTLPPVQRDLRAAYRRYLGPSLLAAAAAHGVAILFLMAPVERAAAVRPLDIDLIPLEEFRVPPPPEELARPAAPVVTSLDVEEDVTLVPTDILDLPPVEAPPVGPPAVPDQFGFTPFTTAPRCTAGCGPDDVLAHVPTHARRQGVECELTVGIRIDTRGEVRGVQLLASSGNPICDQAAAAWARETRWSTAFNRDQPVEVWISQPLQMTTR